MISWAQNLEDVMLARALQHIQPGFYVDVGAYDPEVDSVTRHFYDKGWRGINIDPVPGQIARFSDARPRDINLGVAVGECRASMHFFDFSPAGVSTLDPVIAAGMRARGFQCRESEVPVMTLAQVFDQHAPASVEFLKIDVEGAETRVLAGADFSRHRPRIIVIEATAPMSTQATHDAWEPALLQQGYLFAWFDGLNRFYVRREDAGLLRHFRVQPNVFDDYICVSDIRRGAVTSELGAWRRRRQLRAPMDYAARGRNWLRKRLARPVGKP